MAKPTAKEIDEVLNWCSEAEEEGISNYPGMTYEQGVKAGIDWLQGNGANPKD